MKRNIPLLVTTLLFAVCTIAPAQNAEYSRTEYRGDVGGTDLRMILWQPIDSQVAHEYHAELQILVATSTDTLAIDVDDGIYTDGYMEYRFSDNGLVMAEPQYEFRLDRLGDPADDILGVYEMRANESSLEPDPDGKMRVTVEVRRIADGLEADMRSWLPTLELRLSSQSRTTYVSADGQDVRVIADNNRITVDSIDGETVTLPLDAQYRITRRLPPPAPEEGMLAVGLSPQEYHAGLYGQPFPGAVDLETVASSVEAWEIEVPGIAMRVARATGYLLSWNPAEVSVVDITSGNVVHSFDLNELDAPIDGQTGRWSPDGTRFLATQNFFVYLHEPDVYLFDVPSAQITAIAEDNTSRVLYSGSGGPVPSLDLTPTWAGHNILYQHLERGADGYTSELLLLAPEQDRPRLVVRTPHTVPSVVDVLVSSLDGVVYYTSVGRRSGDDDTGVWRSVPGRRPERIIEATGNAGFPIAAEVSLSGEHLLVHHRVNDLEGTASRFVVFDIESGREFPIVDPDGPYGDHRVVNATLSPDGRYVAAVMYHGESGTSLVLIREIKSGAVRTIFESEDSSLGVSRGNSYSHIGMGWTVDDEIVISTDFGERVLVLGFER